MTPDDARGPESGAGCLLALLVVVGVLALTVYFGISRGPASGALFLGGSALVAACAVAVADWSGWLR